MAESGSAALTTVRPGSSAAGSFAGAVRALRENPIARRELRGLVRQARDWRLWVGLRLPRDARGWGMPAVVWFSLAPYVVWSALALLHRFMPKLTSDPMGIEVALPGSAPGLGGSQGFIDVLGLCFLLLGLYVCGAALAVMAPAVARERQQETWESLRSTTTSPHEILLGLLVGRLLPVLGAFFVASVAWVAAYPHYTRLLRPLAPFTLLQGDLAAGLFLMLLGATTVGLIATAASARSRSAGTAVVAGAVGAVGFGVAMLFLTAALLPFVPPLLTVLILCSVTGAGAYCVALAGIRE